MTINQAIIYNLSLHKCLEKDTDKIFLEALSLGIEALKREKSYRDYELKDKWYPLPGETEG